MRTILITFPVPMKKYLAAPLLPIGSLRRAFRDIRHGFIVELDEQRIEVNWGFNVDPKNEQLRRIDDELTAICRAYKRDHPGREMWVFGHGFLCMTSPFMWDDDHPPEFDESTYHIEVAEREEY